MTLVFKKKKIIPQEKKRFHQEGGQSLNFHKYPTQHVGQNDKQNLFEEANWSQYKPWPKNERRKVQITLNMATIHSIAKKLIAREWARVLGKTQSTKFNDLEKKAAYWKQRVEKEQRRKK